jgi:hypothetical protein
VPPECLAVNVHFGIPGACEGALIIISVYLAIVLEGMSLDREAELSAHTALAQMPGEMREDSADLDEFREE